MKEILYDWGGLNVWLFQLINGSHAGPLDQFMLLGTAAGGHGNFAWFCAGLAIIAWLRGDKRDRNEWLLAVAVFAAGYLVEGFVVGALKESLNFPRPPLALPGEVVVVGTPEFHHSLPSGHASFAMLFAASLWCVRMTSVRMLAVVFVAWVGLSRVYLGFHFPADVLAGFLLSLLVVGVLRLALAAARRTGSRDDFV